MFGNYLGDDEGTAAEGPYRRLLKLRKWLYLSSGLAGLNAAGLLKPEKLSSLFSGLIHVTPTIATGAIITGLALTSIQYAVLLAQLGTTYDIALEDRIAGRRREDLKAAKLELEKITDELMPIWQEQHRLLAEVEEHRVSAPRHHARAVEAITGSDGSAARPDDMSDDFSFDLIGEPHRSKKYKAVEQSVIEYFRQSKNPRRADDLAGQVGLGPGTELSEIVQKIRAIQEARIRLRLHENKHRGDEERLRSARVEYERVLKSDPAERPMFLPIERFLDRLRIWPPIAAGAIAWGHVGYAVWWGLANKA